MSLVFYEKSHRYRLDGAWCPGVTTLIKGGLPNKALMYWSARTVAEYVTDHPDDVDALRRMGHAPMINALKEVPWEKRDVAGVQGTDVHDLAECLVHNEEVDVPDHLTGYVDACVDFLDTWKPTPLVVERPLAHRGHWWAGKPDLFAQLPDGRTILYDYKTGSGIYESYGLQMVAYSRAEFYVDENDVEQPIPPVDLCAAVHLRPDGYDVVPVLGDYDQIYRDFRHVAYTANAAKRLKGSKNQLGCIGLPLDPPGDTT
ncbi:MAG: hypothetical protein ACRDQA_06745 [Nocardioidaceae bacterium]